MLHDCRFFVASAGKLMMILGGIGPRKLGGITSNRPSPDPSDAEFCCFQGMNRKGRGLNTSVNDGDTMRNHIIEKFQLSSL